MDRSPVASGGTTHLGSQTGSGRIGRLLVVDGLRLVAALMVVGYHLLAFEEVWETPREGLLGLLRLPASYGFLGVELFFLISGFVICMSCWGRSVGDFFVSRVARLYPAYIFAVLATTAVLFLVPGGRQPRAFEDVLINLTMLHEPLGAPHVDTVYWTLWAELRFYLLFAIVVWRGLTYRRAVAFCFVWAAAAALINGYGSGPLRHLLMPEYCWYFIAGVAFYLMYRFRPTLLLTGMVVGSFLIAQRSALGGVHARAEKHTGMQLPELPTVMLLAFFFILMALVATGRLAWIRGRWLLVAGALTYPLYLLHLSIGWEMIGLLDGDVPAPLLLSALVAALLLTSWLVHRVIERPGTRWVRAKLRTAFAEARPAGRDSYPPSVPGHRAQTAPDGHPPAGRAHSLATQLDEVPVAPTR